MNHGKTAHMRALRRDAALGAVPGSKFWATPERARAMIAAGEAELMNDVPVPRDAGILKRNPGWPFDRMSTVERAWGDKIVVCLGGGPSLTLEQLEFVAAARADDYCRVIAINDAYLWAPWADFCYFADSRWWQWHRDGINKPRLELSAKQVRKRFATFAGQKCSIQDTATNVDDPAVHMIGRASHRDGLSLRQDEINTGGNSGFQAINLAVIAGASTIVLLGYDSAEPEPGKSSHWHGEHPALEPSSVFTEFRKSFSFLQNPLRAAGVRVINASPGTAITAFERVPLHEALSTCDALTA